MHPEYWTEADHIRYEDRMDRRLEGFSREVHALREEVKAMSTRMTIILGGLGVLAFLLQIAAPFIQALIGIRVPAP